MIVFLFVFVCSRFSLAVINKSLSTGNIYDAEEGINGIGVTFVIEKGQTFCGVTHAKIFVGSMT